MRLIRFGEVGNEKPGVQLSDGRRLDVSGFGSDYGEDFFGSKGVDRLEKWLKENQAHCPVVSDKVRWAAPLTRPSKIICVGLNYAQHAAESGMEVPQEPVLFFKSTSAMVGPNDDLILPQGQQKNRLGGRACHCDRSKGILCGKRKCTKIYCRLCVAQ